MRILLAIHTDLDLNAGAAGSTYWLAEEFRRRGHHVELFSFDDLPRWTQRPDLPDWVTRRLKEVLFPFFVEGRVRRLEQRGGLDVAVISSVGAWWSALRPFRKLSNKQGPLIVTRSWNSEHRMHEMLLEEAAKGNVTLSWKYPFYHGWYQLKTVAAATRWADLATFLNQDDLEYAVTHLGLEPERARLVFNGIPNYLLKLPFEPTPEAEADEIHIVQIGTWIPRKGVAYSVPALGRLLQRYENVHLTIMGTNEVSVAETLAGFDRTVHARITVIQKYAHRDLPRLLEGKHIKVFPTLLEAFGKALIEAMACGLAPVTTSVIPEGIVEDGVNALVVPPRDAEALEYALEKLIRDRALLDQVRSQAYGRAQEFSWGKAAEQRLELYREFSSRLPDPSLRKSSLSRKGNS